MKLTKTELSFFVAASMVLFIQSCKNTPGSIPFPSDDLEYKAVTEPLQFSDPIKVVWDSSKFSHIKPLLKKFDFDKLPSGIYDSTGYLPFLKPPAEASFNWDSLPGKNFNLDNIPSKALTFKTYLLEPPKIIKAGPPHVVKPGVLEFGNEQGVSGTNFSTLLKDKNGILWIKTDKGLCQYDGEYLRIYAIPSLNFNTRLAEDKSGNIWISSQNKGLAELNIHDGTIRWYNTGEDINFSKMLSYDVLIDSNGKIWVTTFKKGAFIIDPANSTIRNFSKAQGLSDTLTTCLTTDKNNTIWIGTATGINIVNTKNGTIKYFGKTQGLPDNVVFSLMQDNSNRIWVSTNKDGNDASRGNLNVIDLDKSKIDYLDYEQGIDSLSSVALLQNINGYILAAPLGKGINIINIEKGIYRHITNRDGLANTYIGSMVQDLNGTTWIANYLGLNLLGQNGYNINHVGTNGITSMAEDHNGYVWIANIYKGVSILDPQNNSVKYLTTAHGLSSNNMNNLQIVDGSAWLFTTSGIDIIDSLGQNIQHIGKAQGLRTNSASGIVKDVFGLNWIVENDKGGIEIWDPQKMTAKYLDHSIGLTDNVIFDIKQDKENNIWISTMKGIDIFDVETNTIKHIINNNGVIDSGFNNKLLSLDSKGRMWIGTTKGLYIADLQKNILTTIVPPEEQSLTGTMNFLSVHDNRVFIETGTGLNIIIPPQGFFTNTDNLKSNWHIETFDGDQGLKKLANSYNSDLATKNGDFWFGDSGITIVHKMPQQNLNTGTYVTGIDVMNQPVQFSDKPIFNEHSPDTIWKQSSDTFFLKGQLPPNSVKQQGLAWDSVSGSYNMPVNLHLPYDKNYLKFYFTGSQMGSGNTTKYRYILAGLDKKWSDISDKAYTTNYLNMAPGDYVLTVSSRNFNGLWSVPAEFKFTINPPWWKTWWANTIYVFLFAVIVWIFSIYRSRNLKWQNKLLEEKVAVRTKALNQSLNNLKSTQAQLVQSEKMASLGELTAGIAHEIQNPLNFVNNFSEINSELIADMKEELAKGNIEEVKTIANSIDENEQKINHHGKRADSIVKNMLQHSRTSSGRKEPTNINSIADEYLRLSYHGMRAKDKSFNAIMKTDFDESISQINIIPQDIGRVLLNLYNNAFYAVTEKAKQHANGYEPTISVTTKNLKGEIEIRVKDNGNGIPQKVLDKIFQPFFTTKPTGEGTGLGLSLSYDIIKAHGGEIKVETKDSEGTAFIILIPYK